MWSGPVIAHKADADHRSPAPLPRIRESPSDRWLYAQPHSPATTNGGAHIDVGDRPHEHIGSRRVWWMVDQSLDNGPIWPDLHAGANDLIVDGAVLWMNQHTDTINPHYDPDES